MKKLISVAAAILVFIFIFASSAPALALGGGGAYTKKNITTYLYSMDKTTTTACLFNSDLPELPYINVMDYFAHTYVISRTLINNGDGTFAVSGTTGIMTADTVNDTVCFDLYETFLLYGVYYEGSSLETDYASGSESYYNDDLKPLQLDLAKYGIDIIEYEGNLYFPVSVLNDIFMLTYNAAEYVDGKLYFLHTMDGGSADGYFDRSSVYENIIRSSKMAEYAYNELCFQMDYFYGAPSKAEAAQSVTEKGFDKALDEYSDNTRAAKELLKSTSLVDFYLGLCSLSDVFYDGGHTVLYYDPVVAARTYPYSAFGLIWNAKFKNSNESKWKMARQACSVSDISVVKNELIANTKKNEYKKYEKVKEWNGTATFLVCGSTAVFSFDSFDNAVIDPFKWSLDYAKEHGCENFLIDISTNTGGSTGVLNYIIAMLTNGITRSATATSGALFTVTGNVFRTKTKIDLNRDGKFNDLDRQLVYDLNFAILTSRTSFSCGNLLPVLAKENGIMILGEQSGGGTCSIAKLYTPECGFYYMSNFYKFIDEEGNDADDGAPVDEDLRKPFSNGADLTKYGVTDPDAAGFYDYDGFYDFEAIGALIDAFYNRGDADDDGEINNKDVALLFRYVSAALRPDYVRVYDFNKDGKVNNKDVTLMFRAVSTA